MDKPKTINQVIAENIAYWMSQPDTPNTQQALSAASGIAQTTISLYLHPENRKPSATGKEPSAKVAELEKIAGALGVRVWNLLRPMGPPAVREFQRKVDEAIEEITLSGDLTP